MRERLPAIAGALALIVVAVVVRLAVFGGDDGDGPSRPDGGNGSEVVVACDPTLAALCDALVAEGLAVEAESDLRLAGAVTPPTDVDVWITWGAGPGIANFDANGTWVAPETLASAPLAVLHTPAAIPAACPDPVTWACLAEGASLSQPLGVGRPDSAEGLARLFPLAEPLVPAEGDFRDIPTNRLQAIVDGPVDGQAPLETQLNMLLTRPGALAAVVGPVDRLATAQARQDPSRLTVTSPSPARTIEVVVAARSDDATLDLSRVRTSAAVTEALASMGLTAADSPDVPAVAAGGAYAVRQALR